LGDQEGILLNNYIPKGQTINAVYYSSLLVQMKDILKEKRRGKFTKVILFLHNAPAHRALATKKKLAHLGYNVFITHPILQIWPRQTTTYSLEKKQLKSHNFSSDKVIPTLETWLHG
jgi:hypothetical protein